MAHGSYKQNNYVEGSEKFSAFYELRNTISWIRVQSFHNMVDKWQKIIRLKNLQKVLIKFNDMFLFILKRW